VVVPDTEREELGAFALLSDDDRRRFLGAGE
jgi:hypothetical protein